MPTGASPPRSLSALAALIDANDTWWRFPEEPGVAGFLGDGVFFVGDQPSTSDWPQRHPSRRVFYDGLIAAGLGNAHLTDLIKAREAAERLPVDFARHLALFREELDLLRPSRVVALGRLCERLLREHVPEIVPMLRYGEHFASAARPNRSDGYAARLAQAAGRHPPSPAVARPPPAVEGVALTGLVTRVGSAPPGGHVLSWTLRRDNKAHHHGIVPWNGQPIVLDLSWRPSKGAPESPVGVYLLDLRGLLDAGVVRYEQDGVLDRIRVRVVMRDDDTFAPYSIGDLDLPPLTRISFNRHF